MSGAQEQKYLDEKIEVVVRGTRLLKSCEALGKKLGVHRQTAWKLSLQPSFPPRKAFSKTLKCWYEPDVDAWLESRSSVSKEADLTMEMS